ncbi:MAG: hypothetical protein AAB074_02820 [Planctomycetota bacterium]
MPRFPGILFLCLMFPLLAGSEPEKKDRAVVYQVWVVEGAMDMIHGGGHWIREIHLPDANISFNVEDDRLNCFVPEAARYAEPKADAADSHAPRRLGEIEVEATFVASLERLLKERDEARDAAKGYLSTAPPLEK